ncbi:MAG TPA: peptidoglycan DD-metalloendopeptidase family protein [Gallionella sp.]|nr:peptidoglycan DD-metalloendopeptidase family protein [Gallionella sp.]
MRLNINAGNLLVGRNVRLNEIFGGMPGRLLALVLMAIMLAACTSGGRRAPVEERSDYAKKRAVVPKKNLRENDWRPQTHIVQRGETLYSIAFNYGLDYRELADLNGIRDPNVISVGQELRLIPGNTISAARTGPDGRPPVRSIDASPRSRVSLGTPAASNIESRPVGALLKEQPRVEKYPYSETAVAQIEKPLPVPGPTIAVIGAGAGAGADEAESKPVSKPDIVGEEGEDVALEWSMPTNGRLISGFSETGNRKGIDIAGKLGQPIYASASGKVVYSGSGLRGYGKLVIIKHSSNYLSAYAHNDQVLVKEGQSVTRGQKIAAMGDSDADQVKLHFEVRCHGKPVDPAKFLPLDRP